MKTRINDLIIKMKNFFKGTNLLTSKEVDNLLSFGSEAGIHDRAGGRGCK
jgi:hypothetical protein